MIVEAITTELIDGVKHIIKKIRYSNGMRVKRTYTMHMVHVDSEILPKLDKHEQGATV